jgi:hypothetical protein
MRVPRDSFRFFCYCLATLAVVFHLVPGRAQEVARSFSAGSFAVGYGSSSSQADPVPSTIGSLGVTDPYVLLYGTDSAFMSGTSADAERAWSLRGDSQEELLWFRHAGKEYLVRDPATLKAALSILSSPEKRTRKAARELRSLLAQAIENGTAQEP